MSWSSKNLCSFIAFTAVGGAVLAGCAGDATVGPNPGVPVIPASGGLVQARGTSNDTVAPQVNPQQVQVTANGGTTTAWIPGGVGLTAGEEVAVFFDTFPIIEGLSAVGGRSHQPGDILVKRLPDGEQYHSGVQVRSDGRLTDRLALPNGRWLVELNGPFTITRGGNRLDVQKLILEGVVRNGSASVPTTRFNEDGSVNRMGLEGELPVNGGTTHTLRIFAWLPQMFGGGHARLRVTHANGTLDHISRVREDGRVLFGDSNLNDNSLIPRTGVLTVEFRYSDEPIVE